MPPPSAPVPPGIVNLGCPRCRTATDVPPSATRWLCSGCRANLDVVSCPVCREPVVVPQLAGGAVIRCPFCRHDTVPSRPPRPSSAARVKHAFDRRGWAEGKTLLGGFVVLGGHGIPFGPSCLCDIVVADQALSVTAVGHARPVVLQGRELQHVGVGPTSAAILEESRWLGGGYGPVTDRHATPARFLTRDLEQRHPGGAFVRLTGRSQEVLLHTAAWDVDGLEQALRPALAPRRQKAVPQPVASAPRGLLGRWRRPQAAVELRAAEDVVVIDDVLPAAGEPASQP